MLLVIPTFIYDGSKLLGIWVPNPSFVVFWPDLGIFLLGGILWELRDKLRRKPKWLYALLFLMGLTTTTLGTIYVSKMNDVADKTFISAIGSAGNLIMAASMFCFVLSCEEFLQKRASYIVATLINKIGAVTMGVYFIHVIFLRTLNHTANNVVPLQSNSGSLLEMTLSTLAYFLISVAICLMGKRIRFLNKIF